MRTNAVAQVVIVANICHVTAITMLHRDVAVNSFKRERLKSISFSPLVVIVNRPTMPFPLSLG